MRVVYGDIRERLSLVIFLPLEANIGFLLSFNCFSDYKLLQTDLFQNIYVVATLKFAM